MSRKYRHQGYQDSDRDDRDKPRKQQPARSQSPEERLHRKGLRHALDRSANEVLRCHVCGRHAQNMGAITPETGCPFCSAPLHCCRTCTHFDSGARWQCRAEITEPVPDKGKANRCASYEPRLVLDATGKRTANRSSGSNDPKSQFDSLFKR